MKIKWYGHSCFMFSSDSGVKIITDPFNKSIPYKLPDEESNIVTTSHDHSDHNDVNRIKGKFQHLNKSGKYFIDDVEIMGIESFHDNSGGAIRGKNIIFKFVIDGISICHCGDLGQLLTDEQLLELGSVDVLLIPVGGTFTIGPTDAVKVMNQINPRITIPMHCRSKEMGFFGHLLKGADDFAKAAGLKAIEMQELSIGGDYTKDYSGIIILKYN